MKNFSNGLITILFCLTAHCGELLKELWSIKIDDITGNNGLYPEKIYPFTGEDGSVAIKFYGPDYLSAPSDKIVWISSSGEVLANISKKQTFDNPNQSNQSLIEFEILGCSNQLLTILESSQSANKDLKLVQYTRNSQGLVSSKIETISSSRTRGVSGTAETINKNIIVTLKAQSSNLKPDTVVCYQLVNKHDYPPVGAEVGLLSQFIKFRGAPVDQYAILGGSVDLKFDVESSIPVAYQWQKDGKDLAGDTSLNLRIDKLSSFHSGAYSLVVKSVFGSAVSTPINVSIVTLPVIYLNSRIVDASFGVVSLIEPKVESKGPTVYQWFRNGVSLVGENQPSIKIPADSVSAEYFLECQNVAGKTKSETIKFNAFVIKNGFKKWEFQLESDDLIVSPPALGDDGTVYFATKFIGFDAGYLYAIDGSSGLKKWEFRTSVGGGDNSSSADVSDSNLTPVVGPGNTVYACSTRKSQRLIYAIDGATGKKRWEALVQSEIDPNRGGYVRPPAIGTDGTVYVHREEGGFLFALNEKNGLKKWESNDIFISQSVWGVSQNPAVGSDGIIWVGFCGLDGANGKYSRGVERSFHINGSSIGFGNLVYGNVRDQDGYSTYAFDSVSLKERWRFQTYWSPSEPVTGLNGLIYIAAPNKQLGGDFYALDGLTGAVKWKIEIKHWPRRSYGVAVGSDGTVYTSISGGLSALNGLTGAIEWEFDKGGEHISAPAISADGTIYAVQKSKVIALASQSKGLHHSPWPKTRSNNQNSSRIQSGIGAMTINRSNQSGLFLSIPSAFGFDTILEYSTNLNQWTEQQRFGRQTNEPSIVVPLKMDQTKAMEYWRTRSQ